VHIATGLAGLLLAEGDKAGDEDLAIAEDGADVGLAHEDVLERGAVRGERIEVGALRFCAGPE
jgi:hypothetical protein